MAKKFTHNVCGRAFRTARGKATHVRCEATTAPAPAPTQEQDDAKSLLAELTLALMSEHEIGWVKANIRARKLVASV
jgi:hypothetical protein